MVSSVVKKVCHSEKPDNVPPRISTLKAAFYGPTKIVLASHVRSQLTKEEAMLRTSVSQLCRAFDRVAVDIYDWYRQFHS